MSPALERTLRELRVPSLVAFSTAIVAALGWGTYRAELARVQLPTMCSRAIDEAFGIDAATTPDSVLLGRVLVHRARCIGDAAYVDQALRLMLGLRRIDAARDLLDEAARRRGYSADELTAQRAWVDLEESRRAALDGDAARAAAARARATATVDRLRATWPEWQTPYLILGELERSAPTEPSASVPPTDDALALEHAARWRLETGAFVRALTDVQAVAAACAVAALALFAFGMAASGLAAIGAMRRRPTSSIAQAKPGYVELTGTLHLPPRTDAVIGPLSKVPGVWYAMETNLGSKGARTYRERSAQHFLLRDATGEVAIDPVGAVVRTRHVRSRLGTSAFVSTRRESERMLRVGDAAYVVGELSQEPTPSGVVERRVHMPEDGRRLLVSTYSEAELITRERIVVWIGTAMFLLAVAALVWGYVQRYQVRAVP